MNELWGYLIVEELMRNGVDYFVIAPGSRSTPLTAAVARHDRARKRICLDERGAAFHAIGYARATGNPAVLICTSGTAAANYFPAVIEAAMDNLPLLILSGDRPPELRQTGANQTINQVNLYRDYVTWQTDLPCPTDEIQPQMVLTTIDLAVAKARAGSGGVVHINCMFREPLAPTGEREIAIPSSLKNWHERGSVYTHYARQSIIANEGEINSIVELINHSQRGILAIGRLTSKVAIEAAIELGNRLNWPIFADIQSGLRLRRDLPNLIHYFDRLLVTDLSSDLATVDTILQLGTRIVSAQLLKAIDKYPPQNYIVISSDLERHDPNHLVSLRIAGDVIDVCQQICQQLPLQPPSPWVDRLKTSADRIGTAIANFATASQLTEPAIAQIISQLIPSQHGLWAGNSMPIRDLDMYGAGDTASPRIGANRGTSGIEGAIAAATGFAVGLQLPVTAIVGDLSSLHDLNSFNLLRQNTPPVIAIIINNDGGAIFSFLPIAKSSDIFETYFGTPHGLNFRHAAAMFELPYYQPRDRAELVHNYQQALALDRSAVIEIQTDRAENARVHQQLVEICQQVIRG